MDVLLTNDDGIDATGLRALREALEEVADVTVAAPAADQSAVGRAMSSEVTIDERPDGFAVHGTPVDCVVAGTQALDLDPDLVVAGCNRGANLGGYTLGRSGTVSAAVEAAFFDVPAIAVSLYFPGTDVRYQEFDPDVPAYAEAARATRYLVAHAPDAGVFEHADYLNVNAPLPPEYDSDGSDDSDSLDGSDDSDSLDDSDGPESETHAPMTVTRPSHVYRIDAERDGDSVVIHDRIWEMMAEGTIPDPPGTDRRAVVEGEVSVTPLAAPHTTEHHEALDGLIAAYDG
ncbi:MAG: 5'/3'-nucleotidase SurE [Haloglomus sp.]